MNSVTSLFSNGESRFMNEAQRFKAKTVSMHFKIEELSDRFEILNKYKIVKDIETRDTMKGQFIEFDQALNEIRAL